MQDYLLETIASATGQDIIVTDLYRTPEAGKPPAGHSAGAVDILGAPTVEGRLLQASKITGALKGGFRAIVENVYGDYQVNIVFENGKPIRARLGRRKAGTQTHASGTHIHVQPNSGAKIPIGMTSIQVPRTGMSVPRTPAPVRPWSTSFLQQSTGGTFVPSDEQFDRTLEAYEKADRSRDGREGPNATGGKTKKSETRREWTITIEIEIRDDRSWGGHETTIEGGGRMP